jgi:hypothetical protein
MDDSIVARIAYIGCTIITLGRGGARMVQPAGESVDLSARPDTMHKSHMIPLSLSRNELAGSSVGARFRRILRHARTPRSLPALFWKNIKYAIWEKIKFAFDSRRPSFWNELGRGWAARERYEEALACYDHALALKGDIPQIWVNRGNALRNLDRLDEAKISIREALRLKPDFANAHNNLARVLDDLGRFEEAEASVRTALRLQPEHAFAHFNLGHILYHLGRAGEAEASYRTALRLRPEKREWRGVLGEALLLAGRLEEGWKEFGSHWQTESEVRLRRLLGVPSWNGEAIRDRVILLLLAEQGHGDTLQFCRYVPQIAARAGGTILAVQPGLVRLLSRLPGVSEIITEGGRPSPFDLWCSLTSLPRAVGTTLETIPATTPYLTADPADVVHWRERLAGLAGLRVGLCWAGGQYNLGQIFVDRRRSITPDMLAPLGEVSGVRFISLQKGPPAAEAARPLQGMELHDFTEDLHDFADTAALIENLDLVISVDTAVAHLAGALGKPVWVLNRFDTDFRWPRDRDDSPWYPSVRQFRQPTPGDWPSVISRAQGALRQLAAGDHSQLRPETSKPWFSS